MYGLSLCSGVGMLDEGASLACEFVFGEPLETVGYCEREAYAAACLLARMEEKSLGRAPVWCGNLEDMPLEPFFGVDGITAGFPCQPWSHAGKREGAEDERWLWPSIARIVGVLGPRYVFLENVSGLLTGDGIWRVLSDLSALGFDAEWGTLAASRVGASHERERVFILGYTRCPARRRRESSRRESRQRVSGHDLRAGGELSGAALDNAASSRRDRGGPGTGSERDGGQCVSGAGRPDLANTGRQFERVQQRAQRVCESEGESGVLADPSGRGCGELRESSELGGRQSDGRNARMGEPIRQRLQGKHADRPAAGPVERRHIEVADAGRPEIQDSETSGQIGAGGPSSETVREMADAQESIGREHEPRTRTEGRTSIAGTGGEVAYTGSERRQGHFGRSGPGEESFFENQSPIFAPGPGAVDSWSRTLANNPHLAPAIKPGLCVLADGLALVVDESRTDQLRCAGNGVVAVQSAACFVELFRRIGR